MLKLIILSLALFASNISAMEIAQTRVTKIEKSKDIPKNLKHKVSQSISTNADNAPISNSKSNTSIKKTKKVSSCTFQCSKCQTSFETIEAMNAHLASARAAKNKCKNAVINHVLTAAFKAALKKEQIK